MDLGDDRALLNWRCRGGTIDSIEGRIERRQRRQCRELKFLVGPPTESTVGTRFFSSAWLSGSITGDLGAGRRIGAFGICDSVDRRRRGNDSDADAAGGLACTSGAAKPDELDRVGGGYGSRVEPRPATDRNRPRNFACTESASQRQMARARSTSTISGPPSRRVSLQKRSSTRLSWSWNLPTRMPICRRCRVPATRLSLISGGSKGTDACTSHPFGSGTFGG